MNILLYKKRNKYTRLHIYRPRSEGDNVLGSVRPSVCMSELSCLSVCRIIAQKSHDQSKMFVCLWTNRADAVDLLLISEHKSRLNNIYFYWITIIGHSCAGLAISQVLDIAISLITHLIISGPCGEPRCSTACSSRTQSVLA